MEFIKNQNWRYATKNFNPDKKVTTENIELLKESIRLSASSFGLQLYKVLIIQDEKIKEQLKSVSWNQSQITDASHLFVLCNYTKVKPEYIDEYIELTSSVRNIPIQDLKNYNEFMKMKLSEKSAEEQFNWTKHQTYIALANLLSACAELKIDTCPMEGFESEQYNKILGLSKKGLNASLVVPIGYRSSEDSTQYLNKIRKSIDLLFEEK